MARRDSAAPATDSFEDMTPEERGRVLLEHTPPEERRLLGEVDERVDGAAVVHWLETGEGDPWDESRD